MNEEDFDEADDLFDKIYDSVHALVDDILEGSDVNVQEYVRDKLTEQFRFWKRE